jgi:hypothetical protein
VRVLTPSDRVGGVAGPGLEHGREEDLGVNKQDVQWGGGVEDFRQLAINTLLACYTQLKERIERDPSEYQVFDSEELAAEYQDLMDAMREFLVALGRRELSRDQFDRMGPVVDHLAGEFSTEPMLKGNLLALVQAIRHVDVALYREQMRRENPNFDALAEQIRREFPEGPPAPPTRR